MTKILIVDDEPQIVRALVTNLKVRGYEVETATTGEEAVGLAATSQPDLLIVDLGLPGIGGIEVIEAVRAWSTVPILVLSVRDAERAKVEALDAGADDYVTKPFGIEELLARVRAATRRTTPAQEEPAVTTADFTVDLAARQVRNASGQVKLTPTEWHVIETLARHHDKLITQRELLQQVWGPGYETETNYLRVYMAQLRRKLEPDPSQPRSLITEAGLGYRLRTPSGR
ncbi:MAG TPA: response regulator [Acidimicrobiales bacterium]|nr:response regulator [Acidimicrobiales bacterium]